MKTVTMTLLMGVALTLGLAARADEATKPAAKGTSAPAPAATTKPAMKGEAPAMKGEAQAMKGEAPKAEAPAAPENAKIDWAKMNKDQRKKYMKATVLPAAKKMFASYDPKKYSKVTCMTCHGEGATNGSFKMPNPELPKLPKSPEGFKELAEKKPEMMKFMGQTVKPEIAALLGLEQWTPQNPKGFGCIGCHETMK